MDTAKYSEKLVSVCRHLGWTAIGCISLYVIFGFVFIAIFTVLGFIAGIFGIVAVEAGSDGSSQAQSSQRGKK